MTKPRQTGPNSIVRSHITTPLGPLVLAALGNQLVGVWFEGQKHFPDVSQWPEQPDTPVLQQAARQLEEYFAGKRQAFELALGFPMGTPFQQSVWQALLRIPHGSTQCYASVSQAIGKPAAIRAVGTAIGRNPLSIVVPCHRVLGSNGALTGYAGGLDRKAALLQTEQRHAMTTPSDTTDTAETTAPTAP